MTSQLLLGWLGVGGGGQDGELKRGSSHRLAGEFS